MSTSCMTLFVFPTKRQNFVVGFLFFVPRPIKIKALLAKDAVACIPPSYQFESFFLLFFLSLAKRKGQLFACTVCVRPGERRIVSFVITIVFSLFKWFLSFLVQGSPHSHCLRETTGQVGMNMSLTHSCLGNT